MTHGYMREFDEDRGEQRDRRRDEDRERGWRDEQRDWNERNFMLGDRGRGWERDRDRYRGFFGSMSNQARERSAFGGRGDWERSPRNFGSSQDDHYRSWRSRQLDALDRDYADYCREREEQFHKDFDAWRRQRRANPQPLQTGMTQNGLSTDPTGTLELTSEIAVKPQEPDPMADATF